jgi:23S rRNA pseudouridine1911/1915/1917 synthase
MNSMSIPIVVEHPWYLIIDKPTGLLTQAVPGIPSVQTLLLLQLHARAPHGPTPFLGVPHRLDRVTSGAMVFARNQRSLRRLSDQFAARNVRKVYRAIVPRISESEGRWVDWLRKVPNEPRAEIVSASAEDAREAILQFRVLSSTTHRVDHQEWPTSLVEIELETGRMHQIRLQFASRGFPILGDSLYSSSIPFVELDPHAREQPIALHAYQIEFRNPQNAERVTQIVPNQAFEIMHAV